jgi:predicted nuclease of predicted toxin-antitoxin system
LKFLLDVHISTHIFRVLSDAGHDAVRAALSYATTSDEDLLAVAVDQGRILITEDSDFSELIFARDLPPPSGLIYIRCEPEHQPRMAGLVIETIGDSRVLGHIAVLTPQNLRFRAFPRAAE